MVSELLVHPEWSSLTCLVFSSLELLLFSEINFVVLSYSKLKLIVGDNYFSRSRNASWLPFDQVPAHISPNVGGRVRVLNRLMQSSMNRASLEYSCGIQAGRHQHHAESHYLIKIQPFPVSVEWSIGFFMVWKNGDDIADCWKGCLLTFLFKCKCEWPKENSNTFR